MLHGKKITVVMPAYNAAATLERTRTACVDRSSGCLPGGSEDGLRIASGSETSSLCSLSEDRISPWDRDLCANFRERRDPIA